MTNTIHAYPKDISSTIARAPRERTGGPRGELPETSSELVEYFMSRTPFGSHMPLDTQLHWDWRNPLNVIPAFMIVLFVLTIVGLLLR